MSHLTDLLLLLEQDTECTLELRAHAWESLSTLHSVQVRSAQPDLGKHGSIT